MSTSELQVEVPCNLCGAADFVVLYGQGVAQVNQIVRCNQCGLMYASPRREADHVHIEQWDDNPQWDVAGERPQRFEKERLQVKDYVGTRAFLNGLHPDRGKLIEVGSGLGLLLEQFRGDGWQVMGIEPDRNLNRYATNKLRIETVTSVLESAGIQDDAADVVVMLHVIEHVPDPVGTLKEIYRILKPGGYLILETPRYDTLMFKLLGRRERSLACDGHIFFFTTDSLRKAYQKAGFAFERLEYVGRSLTLDRLLYNVAVISKSSGMQRIAKAWSRYLMFHKIKFTINVRDMQRVCVRKPVSAAASAA